MPTPFAFDRVWDFAVTPHDLWRTLSRTDQYRSWWPWLRELHVDGNGLRVGATARLVIQAPLPYQLRCTICVDDADPPHLLAATVTGDLQGPARLELRTGVDGAAARLAWTLEVRSTLLRPFATVARPALAWAHDRVVERGLAEFEARALGVRLDGEAT